MAKTDTQIDVMVALEFTNKLERQAQRESRSLSDLVVMVLTEYWQKHGK